MADETNDIVRHIIQICTTCKHGRANLVCKQNPSQCHSRKVKQWLRQVEQIAKRKEEKCTNHCGTK